MMPFQINYHPGIGKRSGDATLGDPLSKMKAQFATEEEARAVAEPFIRAWVAAAALDERPGIFEPAFRYAEVIDRRPPPSVVVHAPLAVSVAQAYASTVVIGRNRHPDSPAGIAVNVAPALAIFANSSIAADLPPP